MGTAAGGTGADGRARVPASAHWNGERASDVLVVDDNPVVRNGLARALRAAGYRVTVAENGVAGLAEVQRHRYRAIVLDLMMPVLDGVECFRWLAVWHPEAARRVVFATAWADDPALRSFLSESGRPVLQKPFEITEFVEAVERVMERAS